MTPPERRTRLQTMTRRRGVLTLCALMVLAACSGGDTEDESGDGGPDGRVPTTVTSPAEADDTAPTTTGPATTDSDVELSGTSWRLVELASDDGTSQEADGTVPAVITFADGRFEGYDGVDTADGTYTTDGSSIGVELEEVSELGPADDPGAEQFLFVLLPEVDRWELDDDGALALHHDDGLLRFEPVGGDTVE